MVVAYSYEDGKKVRVVLGFISGSKFTTARYRAASN